VADAASDADEPAIVVVSDRKEKKRRPART
jgi:hypothetical protein